VAVVRHYGVDPTWVVTGGYDAARHRAAIDDDDPPSSKVLAELIAAAAASTEAPDPGTAGDFGNVLT
jgi:hypothetical protein